MDVDRLVTGLVKDRLLGYLGQVLQQALARAGAGNRTWRPGIKVGSDKDLIEVRRMLEHGCEGTRN